MTRAATNRRMGPVGSANWQAMLDAAEATLREEGYGALTSRRIAERVGVKQRLVYYYFQTMEEVIVETWRGCASRELDRLHDMASRPRPLRELWDLCIATHDSRLISEFMALSNRSEGLRAEVIAFIEEARAIQEEAIAAALARTPGACDIAPDGLALLASSLALSVTREAALGVDVGHGAVLALVEHFLAQVEPEAPGANAP